MKKTIIVSLMIAVCMNISACASNEASSVNSDDSNIATEEAVEDSAVNIGDDEIVETEEAVVEVTESSSEETVEDNSTIYITMNDTIETDKFVMSFESFEIVSELSFPLGDNTSMTPSLDDGNQFALVKGHFENNSSSAIDTFVFDLSFIANEEYSYDDVSFYFEANKYFEIGALEDKNFYICTQIPDKLVEIYESGVLYIDFKTDLSTITTTTSVSSTGEKVVTTDTDNSYALACPLSDSGDGTDAGEQNDIENNEAESSVDISKGDTIVTDEYEFTLNNVELTYEVKPDDTSGVYSSYTAENGKVYIHVDGDYYNSSQKDVCIRDLPTASANYDNGYTYDGFAVVNDGSNSFTWASSYVVCVPLETCHYHCLIECPEIIDQSDASLAVLLPLADGVVYRYNIR